MEMEFTGTRARRRRRKRDTGRSAFARRQRQRQRRRSGHEKVVGVDARNVDEMEFMRRGIIIRPMAGYGLTGHARISIGLPEENQMLIGELKAIVQGA